MSSSALLSDALGEWSGLLGFAALVFALYYMGGGNGNNNNGTWSTAQRLSQKEYVLTLASHSPHSPPSSARCRSPSAER